MKKLSGEKIVVAILSVIVLMNAVMLVRLWLLRNTDPILVLRENKSSYSFPDGFIPEQNEILRNDMPSLQGGWVVRYASKGCIYCKLDYEWDRLRSRLEQLGYRTIILLPKEADRFSDDSLPDNMQQLAFVTMDWIKQFRFTGTPTVIVFNNKGKVIWQHSGIMKADDYTAAEKSIS